MAPFFFDTANAIVFNPFSVGGGFDIPELSGSPNVIMLPDPTTFRVLPWAPETGWVLCDLYMRDGSPFPFAPRHDPAFALWSNCALPATTSSPASRWSGTSPGCSRTT